MEYTFIYIYIYVAPFTHDSDKRSIHRIVPVVVAGRRRIEGNGRGLGHVHDVRHAELIQFVGAQRRRSAHTKRIERSKIQLGGKKK